jgi:hypothetical protein
MVVNHVVQTYWTEGKESVSRALTRGTYHEMDLQLLRLLLLVFSSFSKTLDKAAFYWVYFGKRFPALKTPDMK